MVADALAAVVARISAFDVLIMQNERILVVHKEGLKMCLLKKNRA